MQKSPSNGGWSFAFDPDLPAAQAPAIWAPHVTALMVILDTAPDGFSTMTTADVRRAVMVSIEIDRPDGCYLVATAGQARYRLWVRDGRSHQALAYLIIGDEHIGARRAIATLFHDHVTGGGSSRSPSCLHPGVSERWRLIQFLRLLDALDEDASARDLAATLIAADARAFTAAEWDASRERKRISRWTDKAIAMRDGDFRDLLLGR